MDKYEAQNRYLAKNRVDIRMTLMRSTEQDLIDWLEKQPNKSGYLKELVRADMKHKDQ